MLLLCVSRGKGGGQANLSIDTLNHFHIRRKLQMVGTKCTKRCFELMDWTLLIHWSLFKKLLAIGKENSLCAGSSGPRAKNYEICKDTFGHFFS